MHLHGTQHQAGFKVIRLDAQRTLEGMQGVRVITMVDPERPSSICPSRMVSA
ncbi:hypothetical protein RAA17_18555 [Komagataeibacter rhaeticus]|nr:hypothetical protein [Komagataeibacter rhaeticus]